MTKLAPIEEFAEQLEIYSESHYDSINDTDYTEYTLTKYQLEELRQAIIRDFVSTLEPVGEVIKDENQIKEIVFNAHHWTHILCFGDKLYTLSEWSK